MVFKPGFVNPYKFMIEFEKCFEEKNEDVMKQKLNKFIPIYDKVFFSSKIIYNSFKEVKDSFIQKYINIYLENRSKNLNLEIKDYTSLSSFINDLILKVKKFKSLSDDELVELILDKLPPKLASIFYLKNAVDCVDAIKNFAQILDSNRENTLVRNDDDHHRQTQIESTEDSSISSESNTISTSHTGESRKRAFLRKNKNSTASKNSKKAKKD